MTSFNKAWNPAVIPEATDPGIDVYRQVSHLCNHFGDRTSVIERYGCPFSKCVAITWHKVRSSQLWLSRWHALFEIGHATFSCNYFDYPRCFVRCIPDGRECLLWLIWTKNWRNTPCTFSMVRRLAFWEWECLFQPLIFVNRTCLISRLQSRLTFATTALWRWRKPFSQWRSSFIWKLSFRWLKRLLQSHVAFIIDVPMNEAKIRKSGRSSHEVTSLCVLSEMSHP